MQIAGPGDGDLQAVEEQVFGGVGADQVERRPFLMTLPRWLTSTRLDLPWIFWPGVLAPLVA